MRETERGIWQSTGAHAAVLQEGGPEEEAPGGAEQGWDLQRRRRFCKTRFFPDQRRHPKVGDNLEAHSTAFRNCGREVSHLYPLAVRALVLVAALAAELVAGQVGMLQTIESETPDWWNFSCNAGKLREKLPGHGAGLGPLGGGGLGPAQSIAVIGEE